MEMEGKRIANVIVDVAHSNVDRIFDYLLPEGIEVLPGQRVLVPFGHMQVEAMVLSVGGSSELSLDKLKKVGSVIDSRPIVTEEQITLAEYICKRYATTLAFALRLMYPAKMRGGRIGQKHIRMISIADRERAEEERARCFTREGKLRAKNRLHTLDTLLAGEAPAAVLDGASVRYLLERRIASERMEQDDRRPYADLPAPRKHITLTPGQQKAAGDIANSVQAGERNTILLHGVTGSGKTEVYIEAVRSTLEMGKTAIVLVPEISLAPQLYGEFERNFAGLIAVFHSGLSDGEKYDEWRRVREGSAKIVLGARSAVFLPLQNLGLIIIDEEHEQSYKADNHPPYHAAEIARMRSHLCKATLVLASATPLVEDYMKAQMGIYRLIELPERIGGLSLPDITVVDMKKEFVRGNRTPVSGALHQALSGVLARGEQALLFLNRRGYASSVVCPSCGHVRMCARCDVPLKYHKTQGGGGRLLCHYCGRVYPLEAACPECGQGFVKLAGVGTQQLEEHIARLFPQARILRMDFDTTRRKDAHRRIYEAFQRKEADILIGTQMIARGLDFDDVTLSALVSADGMLTSGDYRAEERTFSMIEQVGGRAGRKKQGRVIVQTYDPEHYAIRYAQRHDYRGFYEAEVAFRKAAQRPPFSRVFRMVFSGPDEAKVKKVCDEAEILLKPLASAHKSDIILFVAKPAPVARLDGKYRYHILMKVRATRQIRQFEQEVLRVFEQVRRAGVRVAFDVNPYDVN